MINYENKLLKIYDRCKTDLYLNNCHIEGIDQIVSADLPRIGDMNGYFGKEITEAMISLAWLTIGDFMDLPERGGHDLKQLMRATFNDFKGLTIYHIVLAIRLGCQGRFSNDGKVWKFTFNEGYNWLRKINKMSSEARRRIQPSTPLLDSPRRPMPEHLKKDFQKLVKKLDLESNAK